MRKQIEADLKKAMLAKDTVTRDALRMVKSELVSRENELGRELEDAEAVGVLQKAVKSRRESLETYEEAGRDEAAAKERQEIEVIERYLPKQMDEAETKAALEALAKELGVSDKKDMGRLMKELKARHPGQVDMKVASKLAGQILG